MGNLESGFGTILDPLRLSRVQIADNLSKGPIELRPGTESRTSLLTREMTGLGFESSVPSTKTMRIVHSEITDHRSSFECCQSSSNPCFLGGRGSGSLGYCARSVRGKGAETLSSEGTCGAAAGRHLIALPRRTIARF